MADLAKLVVRLEAQSGRLEGQLERANRKISKFEKTSKRTLGKFESSMNSAGLAIKRFVAVAVAGFATKFVSDTVRMASAVEEARLKIGVSAEELQQWQYIAEQSGVSANTLNTAMQRFTRRIGEAAKGTGVLRKELIAENIAIRDSQGNIRPVLELWNEYGEAIGNASTAGEKLQLVIAGMDTEAAGLVNVFNMGSDAINEMGESATVLSNDMTKRAKEIEGFWTEMVNTMTGTLRRGVLGWLGLLKDFTDKFADVSELGAADLGQERIAVNDRLIRQLEEVAAAQSKVDRAPHNESFAARLKQANSEAEKFKTELAGIDQQLAKIATIRRAGEGMLDLPEGGTAGTPDSPGATTTTITAGQQRNTLAEDFARIRRQTLSEEEKLWEIYIKQAETIDAAVKAGDVSAQNANLVFATLTQNLQDARQELAALGDADYPGRLASSFKGIEDSGVVAADSIGDAFSSNLASAAQEWESFGDLLGNIADSIANIVINSVVSKGVQTAIDSFGSGDSSGSGAGGVFSVLAAALTSSAGSKAGGGPVAARSPYLVGERGPELFVPHSAGNIVPDITGGSVVINNMGPPIQVDSERQSGGALELTIRQASAATQAAIVQQLQTGYGPVVQAMHATTNMRTIPR